MTYTPVGWMTINYKTRRLDWHFALLRLSLKVSRSAGSIHFGGALLTTSKSRLGCSMSTEGTG